MFLNNSDSERYGAYTAENTGENTDTESTQIKSIHFTTMPDVNRKDSYKIWELLKHLLSTLWVNSTIHRLRYALRAQN